MRALKYFKSIFTIMVSMTLIHAPIAYAQEDAKQTSPPPSSTVTTKSSDNSHTDPNWCTSSKSSEVNSCKEQGLAYNCHLQVCAKEEDNRLYNDEYNDCNARAADQRAECRANLQSLGNELITHNQMIKDNSNPDAGSNGMNSTVVAGGGAIATAAMGCGAFGVECASGTGAALLGAVTLAIAFMAMQAKQYEDQFKAAAELFKAEDENNENGWSKDTQTTAFQKQIQAFDMIAKAAQDKAKHHNMVAMLATVIAVIAGVIASTVYGNAVDPCAIPTAIAGGVVAILEYTAASHAKGVASEAKAAKEKVEKILAKFEKHYNQQNISTAIKQGSTSVAASRSGVGSAISSGISSSAVGGADNKLSSNAQCVSSDNSVGNCPCKGKSCYDFDFKIPNNQMSSTVDSALGFKSWEDAANQAAAGNTQKLEGLSNNKNSALASKVAKRTNSYLLKKKGKSMSKADKDMLKALIDPTAKGNARKIAAYAANRFSPVKAAALISKNGLDKFDDESSKTGKSPLSLAKYNPAAFDSSSISDMLKDIEDQSVDDGYGSESSIFGQGSDGASTEQSAEAPNLDEDGNLQDLNPDRRMSIFKVISNRYNVLRVKRRLP